MEKCQAIPSLVAARAAAAPDAVAITDPLHTVTYGALERRANRLAHRLRALGVAADGLVGLFTRRSPALAVGALGIMKAGGAYIPLDASYPEARLGAILRDARPTVVVAERGVADGVPAGAWSVVTLAADGSGLDGESEGWPAAADTDGARRAYVIFTSGSTGTPKGVEITHAGLANLIAWHLDAFGVTPEDRATQTASPAFDAAVWEMWPYLVAGASVHAPDDDTRLDPHALRDWLVRERITISFAATPLAEQLMTLPWPEPTALRIMLTGADTLHRHARAGLPFTVVNNYGPTECTVVTTSGTVPLEGAESELPGIGAPIPGVTVHVLDEAQRPLGAGEIGELYIGGAGLARGYLNRPDLTRDRFVTPPGHARLYRTGDRVRWRPDGTLAFLGRMDEQIKIRGHRIEPHEIVAVLDTHPLVRASAVVAREDDATGLRLVAYIVPAPGAHPSPRALLDTLRQRVPPYMLPSTFVHLLALPLTSNGKLDRHALPAPSSTNVLSDAEATAPRNPVEHEVARILARLLAVETVNASDNFFLLGGHSLLGTQLIARVRAAFGVELSLRTLFNAPTVAALSAEIVRARRSEAA